MKLISMLKTGEATYSGSVSLDALHDAATQLGKVTVDHAYGTGQYVEIQFTRKSGSRVYARGSHTDIREAYRLAIEEAIALGASR